MVNSIKGGNTSRKRASIEIRGLTKKFGKVAAVDHIHLVVYEGELFGFLGPNGAGKTTTINILTTLVRQTSGKAKVAGFDVETEAEKVRGVIGLVPQEITLDDDLTGWENLMLQARLYHIPTDEARKRIKEVLNLVDLADVAGRKVDTYSGGMSKRLELAGGLLHRPRILFLDEPTLGLDVQTRAAIWDYIRMLREKHNMTIFLTTHYMEEADSLCDRIAIIDHGKIKTIDTPSNLKNNLGGDIIEVAIKQPPLDIIDRLQSLSVVKKAGSDRDTIKLAVERGEEALPVILERLIHWGLKVTRVALKTPSLDEVFLEYTGRSLREQHVSWDETFSQRMAMRRTRT